MTMAQGICITEEGGLKDGKMKVEKEYFLISNGC